MNPGGVVYGVLAVATVIAAESARKDSFATLVESSVITMALYWIAHAYSHHWGARFEEEADWSLGRFAHFLVEEASILIGASVPILVLVVAWVTGSSRETAITAVLWCAVVELVLLEVVPALRRRHRFAVVVADTALGLSMGLGILGLRLLLH